MNRKIKVYLDTSVISYLLQEDAPEKMAETRQLWDIFKQGKYDIFVSAVTIGEINKCSEPKRSRLIEYLDEINYSVLEITPDMLNIADKIIEMGILTKKSYDDCQHIAAAIIGECDFILSWNFKHIVNIKTINGVRTITSSEYFKPIEIRNPTVLLESEE